MDMYFAYVLRSTKNGRHYTGSTSNLDRRLEEHNRGKTRSLKSQGPFELIYKEEFETRIGAVRREKFLKSGKGREYLKEMGI